MGKLNSTRWALAAAVAIAVMTMATPRAHAFDPRGFGLGASVSLGGVNGFEGIYWLSPDLALDGLIGTTITDPRGGNATANIRLAFGMFFNLMRWNQTNFGLGGRAGFGVATSPMPATDALYTLSFEFDLRGEHMFDDHFGINACFGLVGIGTVNAPVAADTFTFGAGNAVGPFASAGFLFYFDSIAMGAGPAPVHNPPPPPAYNPPPADYAPAP